MEYNYWLPITSYCLNCGWIITSCGCVILTWGQIWQVVKEEGILILILSQETQEINM
jgi:hypothetical protein